MNMAVPAEPRPTGSTSSIRGDLQIVSEFVTAGSRVLDIGCGDGDLLAHLARAKQVDGRGIEISQAGVNQSVRSGLSVVQGDAEQDLAFYPDESFDYVVLSRTLQAVRDPRGVLLDLVRIGRRAIVSFPNYGYWRIRLQLLLTGRMPKTELLGDPWYATNNIHLCTIADFIALCADVGIAVERAIVLSRGGKRLRFSGRHANLLGEQAIFLLRREHP